MSRGVFGAPARVGSYVIGGGISATAIGLSVANVSNSTVTANVYLNDGVDNTHIVYNAPIPSGGTLVALGGEQKLVMVTGDSIFIQSTGPCDVILSVLEIS